MLSQWKIGTILVAVLTLPVLSYSDTIIVPDDHPTIQGAIDAAETGDTVLVKPGTYVENIDFKGKAITVASEQGAAVTVIDGNQAGSVVVTNTMEGPDSVLDGFTLTNGTGTYSEYWTGYWDLCGGGILCHNSSPTIMNNIISGNKAVNGGGVSCNSYTSPNITNNAISGNTASDSGGGIYCARYVTSIIMSNTISGNMADYNGGGISCSRYAAPDIMSNTISENTCSNRGGGISFFNDCTGIISNNIISGNAAVEDGGGINCYFCSPPITNNIISGNTCGKRGAGIYSSSSSSTIANNIISGNTTSNFGGGIYCGGSWPTITNCTIIENKSHTGGGLYCHHDSVVTVANTIFWNNSALTIGPEICLKYNVPYILPELSISYTDVDGGQGSVYIDPGSTLNWGAGMIDLDPLFADLGRDDFHLTYSSPCRGSGDNSTVTELYDFEGDPRIAWGGNVDMGADEFYTHLYVTGNTAPGGAIVGKFIGLPGTTPVGLFIGSGVLSTPANTMWGEFWLQAPWFLFGPLGAIPSDGVMVLPTTLPGSIPAPYDIPMQALIGLNPDSLSNLCVLEVR